jgi:hypothetical protein
LSGRSVQRKLENFFGEVAAHGSRTLHFDLRGVQNLSPVPFAQGAAATAAWPMGSLAALAGIDHLIYPAPPHIEPVFQSRSYRFASYEMAC